MKRYLTFYKVIELGSFSKAAQALGYSQSAASQMVASLEEELGIRLINRSRTGATLTPEGKKIFPKIEQMIFSYRAMQEKTKEIKGLDTGVIRMGTVASISAHWLPGIIREFQDKHPGVTFVTHQGDYTSIQEWIKTGMIDFGFINPTAASGIVTETIKSGNMLAVLPAGHPLAVLDTVPLAALCREPFILLEEGHYSEPLAAFQEAGLHPDVRYTIHDDYSIMLMVEAGLGVSILAELILHRTNYNIVTRRTDPQIRRTIAVGYKGKGSLPIAARRFINALKSKKDILP